MKNNQSLYRKYRPSTFDHLAGHFNIVEILKKQLQNNTLSHAFLFTGQRGTGKTSVARILAKATNCKNLNDSNPCETCDSCRSCNLNESPDIFEIDAASNNGVDEIRNIKMNVSTLPILGQYKVYIIDEVHMLSKGAFNALLKTLEEPPIHAIFILATTEYSKIPATILSRCQILNFKKIDKKSLEERVKFVSNKEGHEISDEVLQEIFFISEGSLRDALNILEQLTIISDSSISMNELKKVFSIASKKEKILIIENILKGNAEFLIKCLEKWNQEGMEFDSFALSLIEIIKEIIEVKLTGDYSFLEILEKEKFKIFENISIEEFFKISDNLSDAYANTKNNSVSFNYILISLLKSLSNHEDLTFVEKEKVETNIIEEEIIEETITPLIEPSPIQEEKELEEQTIEVQQDTFEVSEDTLEETIDIVEKMEDDSEEEIVDEPIPFDFPETDDFSKTIIVSREIEKTVQEEIDLLDIQNLKTKELENYTKSIGINTPIIEVINTLVGANKEKRIQVEESIFQIFEIDDNNFLVDPKRAKRFLPFFDIKIPAVSENEVLINCETEYEANFIKSKMLNSEFRNELFEIIGKEYAIIPVNKTKWEDVKVEYVRRKKINNLPTYNPQNLAIYYETMNTSSLDEEILGKASTLFDLDDIKIGY